MYVSTTLDTGWIARSTSEVSHLSSWAAWRLWPFAARFRFGQKVQEQAQARWVQEVAASF